MVSLPVEGGWGGGGNNLIVTRYDLGLGDWSSLLLTQDLSPIKPSGSWDFARTTATIWMDDAAQPIQGSCMQEGSGNDVVDDWVMPWVNQYFKSFFFPLPSSHTTT